MIRRFLLCILLCWFISDTVALPNAKTLSEPTLDSWPMRIAQRLDKMIKANAHTGAYACFDADQTSYQWDLEESIFAYLETKKIITRNKLDPTLILIPFLDTPQYNETLFSYYYRICSEIDDTVCYTWIAQVFSGLTLKRIKTHVDEMLQSNTGNTTIKTVLTTSNGNAINRDEYHVPIPNCYRAQQELYNRLMANGIEVYVITAAHKEIVRMVLSDPKYGYNVKPENIIGINTLLKNGTQKTTARKQIQDGTYNEEQNLKLTVTSYLWSPQTMFVGKYSAILHYIDQWKMPILVAGDTPISDGYMLFHAYNKRQGTIRLWVNRKDSYLTLIKQMRKEYVQDQRAAQVMVTANRNWIYMKWSELGPKNGFF